MHSLPPMPLIITCINLSDAKSVASGPKLCRVILTCVIFLAPPENSRFSFPHFASFFHQPSSHITMEEASNSRPLMPQTVSFQPMPEDRHPAPSAGGNATEFKRKRSLVRPDRERIEPGHRLYNYVSHADDEGINIQASSTGNRPIARRGKSILDRSAMTADGRQYIEGADDEAARGVDAGDTGGGMGTEAARPARNAKGIRAIPGPVGPWMTYCYCLTICFPNFMLHGFGMCIPDLSCHVG